MEANPGRVSNGATGMSVEDLVHIARCVLLEGGLSRLLHFPGFPTQTDEEHSSVSLPSVLHHSGTILHANPLRLSFCSETKFGMDSQAVRLTS